LEELAILRALDGDPSITQKQLAEKIGKSERTVKTRTVEMQEKGLIRRLNGKRNGTWEILIEINE
jgi:DNA-binding Lrp family transcriptional regulator